MRKIHTAAHLVNRVYVPAHSEVGTGFHAAHVPFSKTELKRGSERHQTLLLNLRSSQGSAEGSGARGAQRWGCRVRTPAPEGIAPGGRGQRGRFSPNRVSAAFERHFSAAAPGMRAGGKLEEETVSKPVAVDGPAQGSSSRAR